MKIRTGRHNDHTLYLQLGDDAASADPPLGFAVNGQAAAEITRLANIGIESHAIAGDFCQSHHFGLQAQVTR